MHFVLVADSSTNCPQDSANIAVAVGVGAGSLVLGIIIGAAITILVLHKKYIFR